MNKSPFFTAMMFGAKNKMMFFIGIMSKADLIQIRLVK